MIGLGEEHVDDRGRLGWREPFSSAQSTPRQGGQAVQTFRFSAYTPQVVVDGQQKVIASDYRGVLAALRA